jgi:hypothetical protein
MPQDNPMPQERQGVAERDYGELYEEHPDKVAVAQPNRPMHHAPMERKPQFPSPGIQVDAHIGDGKRK